jgi:hypothetical protein
MSTIHLHLHRAAARDKRKAKDDVGGILRSFNGKWYYSKPPDPGRYGPYPTAAAAAEAAKRAGVDVGWEGDRARDRKAKDAGSWHQQEFKASEEGAAEARKQRRGSEASGVELAARRYPNEENLRQAFARAYKNTLQEMTQDNRRKAKDAQEPFPSNESEGPNRVWFIMKNGRRLGPFNSPETAKAAAADRKAKDLLSAGRTCDNCGRSLPDSAYLGAGSWSYKCPNCGFKYNHSSSKSAEEQVDAFHGD